MTAEVSRLDCAVEAAEDELDLFEMDQITPDDVPRPSSVEFIQTVLVRFSHDLTEDRENK